MTRRQKTQLWALIFVMFLAMVIIFSSCSPQRRLNSLAKHHPELFKTDTVSTIIRDTIYWERVILGDSVSGTLDTLPMDSLQPVSDTERETVYIWKDRDKVRYKVITKAITIHDTIPYEKKVSIPCKCPSVTCERTFLQNLWYWTWHIGLGLMLLFIGYIVGRLLR